MMEQQRQVKLPGAMWAAPRGHQVLVQQVMASDNRSNKGLRCVCMRVFGCVHHSLEKTNTLFCSVLFYSILFYSYICLSTESEASRYLREPKRSYPRTLWSTSCCPRPPPGRCPLEVARSERRNTASVALVQVNQQHLQLQQRPSVCTMMKMTRREREEQRLPLPC